MDDEKTLKRIIRTELEKLKKLTWKERLVYIWDYYKPLLVILFGIWLLISVIVTMYHNMQLEYLMNAYFINSNALEVDSDRMTAEFVERIGGIGPREVVTIDTTLDLRDTSSQYGVAAQMKMTALMSAETIDLLIVDQETYERYKEMGYFADFSTLFSEEQLEEWADLLVGADGKRLADKPDGGTAYGLDLTEAPVLSECNAYMGNAAYGVVAVNAVRTDLCDDFFSYLLGE